MMDEKRIKIAENEYWKRLGGNPHLPDMARHLTEAKKDNHDNQGKPEGCSEDSVAPLGESLVELKDDLDHYQQALKKPVLVYDSLEEAEEQWG
jgi:hypothetical protein